LVIAADGTHSRIRDNAGITTKVHDYQQTAIVANLSVKHPVNGVAYERFTQVGPIALLPLGDKKVKCVWVVSGAEKAQALCALPEKAFIEALGHAFGHRLGPVLSLGLRNTYPLVSRVADTLYANGLVLMGNAAATLHPIAAQGFNLAVRDIATLAEALWHAKLGGQSLDDVRILQSYAHSRMPDRNAVIGLTHGLSSSFEITRGPVKQLRHWGLVLCDTVPVLKRWITRRGVGFAYPLPKLCCGVPLCP
jgi:2-octaprenyl-6-methoxyphenol hydroxylase